MFCYSQVMKEKLDQAKSANCINGEWTEIEWTECNIICVIDFDSNKIKIYSTEYQDYDIVSDGEETTSNGTKRIKYKALDTDGMQCYLSFITCDGTRFIYIEWSNALLMYSFEND